MFYETQIPRSQSTYTYEIHECGTYKGNIYVTVEMIQTKYTNMPIKKYLRQVF